MSTVKVLIPQFLSHLIEQKQELQVEAGSMEELKTFFQQSYSEFGERIWTEEGAAKRNVLFVLNDELIKANNENTEFASGDELGIILQFAGG
ncbi:MoaD/ThiS family protein [Paenibacillus sp. FSL R5-0912]|uniref:MoaD/ThiS family protein n=1 Tax=Paenibacillus sp. FSL R5-0912 TaxID=1536771 RepID=UPI0004F90E11|nr:MoaD/ThiS family protein [Paenibacillus sp. FSL R5-0912]AIQ42137.1 hypothetical protein R50912_20350 [Paenibacillus sp. FSL R5-0912]